MAASTDNQVAEMFNAALTAVTPGTDLAFVLQNAAGQKIAVFTIAQFQAAMLTAGLARGVVAPRPLTADIGKVPVVQADLSLAYGAGGGGSGSVWYSGVGAPSDAVGANGDYYLRGSDGHVYTKAAGTWSDSGIVIKGANGTDASPDVTINTQTGDYTLVLTDDGKQVEMNKATALTLTVPPNASVAFPVGATVEWSQYGAGLLTIAAGAGVTIRSRGGALNAAGQYAGGTLRKLATNEWYLFGDIA